VNSTNLTYRRELSGVVTTHNLIGRLRDWLSTTVSHFQVRKPVTCLPLNYKNVVDLRNVKQYIPEEHKEFYTEIFQWPTTQAVVEVE
jgi:hypothetical protein